MHVRYVCTVGKSIEEIGWEEGVDIRSLLRVRGMYARRLAIYAVAERELLVIESLQKLVNAVNASLPSHSIGVGPIRCAISLGRKQTGNGTIDCRVTEGEDWIYKPRCDMSGPVYVASRYVGEKQVTRDLAT